MDYSIWTFTVIYIPGLLSISEYVVIIAFQFDFQFESIFDANKAYCHIIITILLLKNSQETILHVFLELKSCMMFFILQLKFVLIVVN